MLRHARLVLSPVRGLSDRNRDDLAGRARDTAKPSARRRGNYGLRDVVEQPRQPRHWRRRKPGPMKKLAKLYLMALSVLVPTALLLGLSIALSIWGCSRTLKLLPN